MQIGQLFEQLRHTTRAAEVAGRGPGMDVLHGPRTTNRTTTLFRIGSGPVSWISVDTGYWFFWGLWFSPSWWDAGVPHTIMLFLLPHMLSLVSVPTLVAYCCRPAILTDFCHGSDAAYNLLVVGWSLFFSNKVSICGENSIPNKTRVQN
jgi:hypothetical protein